MKREEAIQNLKENIKSKENQIEQLKNFKKLSDKGLTEEQYHDFCSTDLRYSDELGKSLSTVFPFLSYKGMHPNFFLYNVIGEDDLEIRIPNSRCFEVEIVVKKYLFSGLILPSYLSFIALDDKISVKNKYLETKSFIKKARIMFPHLKPWLAYIGHLLYNIKWIFKIGKERISPSNRVKNEIVELSLEREKLVIKEKTRSEQAEISYFEQQALLKKYSLLFLQWTKSVSIYSKNIDRPKAEHTMENGKLKITHC